MIDDYVAFDQSLLRGDVQIDATMCRSYIEGYGRHPLAAQFEASAGVTSMLHSFTLGLIRAFALAGKGTILEIGAYIGGSTIAAAKGLMERGSGHLVAVEVGGSYPGHPSMPSQDIPADWLRNISIAGIKPLPSLVLGWSFVGSTIARVEELVGTNEVGVLIVDSDGDVARALCDYSHLLRGDCLIIADDYMCDSSSNKGAVTKTQIDGLVNRGEVEEFGIFPWGTWFGRLKGTKHKSCIEVIPEILERDRLAYIYRLPHSFVPDQWRVMCNDRELLVSSYEDVCVLGDGRYTFVNADETNVLASPILKEFQPFADINSHPFAHIDEGKVLVFAPVVEKIHPGTYEYRLIYN